MYKKQKFLAIIPARSGSKGINNKNIKLLNNKPLMAYTIEAAKESEVFDDIIVSTDSEEYKIIAEKYGAKVPFLRDISLSGDFSKTEDVIIDTIINLEKIGKKYDYFVLLQPTSPLRNFKHIKEAIDLILDEKLNSVISVCEVDHPLQICNTLKENKSMYNFISKENNILRQEMKKNYRINGAIYIMNIDEYLKSKNFYNEKSKAYLMEKKFSIDIDDEIDFLLAEAIMLN